MSERVWAKNARRAPKPSSSKASGTDVGEQLREVLLAVGGEPVDPLAAPRAAAAEFVG